MGRVVCLLKEKECSKENEATIDKFNLAEIVSD